MKLETYMNDIEDRLDTDEEARLRDAWLRWADHLNEDAPFAPPARSVSRSRLAWPHVNINDAINDPELSVYRELETVNRALEKGTNGILRVRPNFGVGNIATSFGAEQYIMPRETDELPNVKHLDRDALRAIPDRPLPKLTSGNFAMVMRVAERLTELREKYPKFAACVRMEQPDLQGPMDNLELLWGSDIFYAFYDEPETVHALLERIAGMIEKVLDEWLRIFPDPYRTAGYFRHIERGAIALRNDSVMNLSEAFFREFVMPYDGRLLKKYGGIVHFCGRGDHFIGALTEMEGLNGVNMSQPHLNDMEKIFAFTIDRGVHLSISTAPFEVTGHETRNLVFLP